MSTTVIEPGQNMELIDQTPVYSDSYFSVNKLPKIYTDFTIPNFSKVYAKIKEPSGDGNSGPVVVANSSLVPLQRQQLLVKLYLKSTICIEKEKDALGFVMYFKATLRPTTFDVGVALIGKLGQKITISSAAYAVDIQGNSKYAEMSFTIACHLVEKQINLKHPDTLVLSIKFREKEIIPTAVGDVGRYLLEDTAFADVEIVVKHS